MQARTHPNPTNPRTVQADPRDPTEVQWRTRIAVTTARSTLSDVFMAGAFGNPAVISIVASLVTSMVEGAAPGSPRVAYADVLGDIVSLMDEVRRSNDAHTAPPPPPPAQ